MSMKSQIAVAVLAFCGPAVGSLCGSNAKEIGGNWYCSAVEQLSYANFGTPGEYNQITSMGSDGSCESVTKSFEGPLAPLDGEVSLHFRGPIALKKFASYSLTSSKRSVSKAHIRRHGHAAFHDHQDDSELAESTVEEDLKKRADVIVATIAGQVVSWKNNWYGPDGSNPTPTPAANKPDTPVVPAVVFAKPTSAPAAKAPNAPAKSTKAASSKPGAANGNSAYTRTGYYDAESQTLDGLVFLGNYGGAGSGVFDSNFGNSLSYLGADGISGSESAQILGDKLIGSNQEFAIMTDKECTGDSCGYVRPGTVAYHGFDGADKVFLFEFSMPSDGTSGFNGDMPAIWMLNADIPRTLQYGKPECSCWATGCGEFDIVEVLSPGSSFCKSTLHTNTPGGDSNYIVRQTSGTMKLAVIFQAATSEATIQVLPADTDFSTGLTSKQISDFTGSTPLELKSLFSIVA